jgi:hypothetical protein
VVARPEGAVPLVESNHSLDALEGTPRRPRCATAQFVAQRRPIEGVARAEVCIECPRVNHIALVRRSRAYQHVIVEMRLTVSIHSVGKTHHTLPLRRPLTILTASAISHDQGVLFEVGHRGSHRRAMCVDHAASTVGVKRKENRDGPRGCDHEVVARHFRSLARDERSLDARGITSVALSAKPPPRPAVTYALQLSGPVAGEVCDVVRFV